MNQLLNKILLLCLLAISFTVLAEQSIDQVLNRFHQAAANADGVTYFDLLADDGVFLGTDATERWTKQEFRAYAEPYFRQGKGWAYHSIERHISLSSDGKVAFFDELLTNNNYGKCRGSGVLWKTAHGWKIAQYNLSVPLPNAIAKQLVKKIAEYSEK